MRKTLKIIFCSLVIVTILTANVFASGWADYTPDFTDETAILFTENITSAYSAETMEQVVTNAYNIGLFGGAIPIAVTCVPYQNYENALSIQVVCVCPIIPSNMSGMNPPKSNAYGYMTAGDINEYLILSTEGNIYMVYTLLNNGDCWAMIGLIPERYELGTDEKVLLIKEENNGWTYDDNSSLFAQFYNVDASENETLTNINGTYLRALDGFVPPSEPSEPSNPPVYVQYMLDIPGIITAIPNGAKQIINNAFGFEIFGINVAGLLSALIIIAIVAYAVKKMMTR